MEYIRVVATRTGKWWAIQVPDHPGVFSQARRLDQVPEAIADALSLWLDRSVSQAQVVVDSDSGEDLEVVLDAARRARDNAKHATAEASAATRRAVAKAIDAGLPLRDVGRLLGLTHQRVAAIARDVRAKPRGAKV